jgi:hypothetical protein
MDPASVKDTGRRCLYLTGIWREKGRERERERERNKQERTKARTRREPLAAAFWKKRKREKKLRE